MKFVNNEPRGYGAGVGVHVENKERTTHWKHLYDKKRSKPKKVMIDPDKLIPIFRGEGISRFFPELQIQIKIIFSTDKALFANMSKHPSIHFDLIHACITITSTYLINIFLSNIPIIYRSYRHI
jgi:hypothetical protein